MEIKYKRNVTFFKATRILKSYIPDIGKMVRVFVSGSGDLGSIPGRIIPNTFKMVLDASLHYKVWIKGKVEKSRKRSSALLYTSVY